MIKKYKAKKRTKKRRVLKGILLCLCVYFLYTLLGATLYHLQHKKVNEDTKREIDRTVYTSDSVCTERVLCIDDNDDALYWRLRLINEAKEEITYSCFEVHDDKATFDVFAALYDAAERGVKVNLLFDGIFTGKNLIFSSIFRTLAYHENVTLKLYNIPNIFIPWQYSFRMHDKYIICDRKMYMLGGRNTFDKFLGSYSSEKNIDREILVYDTEEIDNESSINQLNSYFEKMWEASEEVKVGINGPVMKKIQKKLEERACELPEIYPLAYTSVNLDEVSLCANKITLLSNSTDVKNKEPIIMYTLYRMMKDSEKIFIQTPYLIMDDWMFDELSERSAYSDISVITNSVETGANYFGCGDYLFEKKRLSTIPMDRYELVDSSSHTKAFLFDERLCVVGSFNYDMRSSYLDTELMLAIDSPELYSELHKTIEGQINKSRHIDKYGNMTYGSDYEEVELTTSRMIILYICGGIGRLIRHLF